MYPYFPTRVLLGIFLLLFSVFNINAQGDSTLQHRVNERIFSLLDKGKFTEAQKMTISAIQVFKGDTSFVGMLYLILSDAERLSGNKDRAIEHILTAEEILQSAHRDFWSYGKYLSYGRRANLYFEMQKYDSAYVYAKASINAAKDYDSAAVVHIEMMNLPIIAYYHLEKKQYDLSDNIYKRTVFMIDSLGGNACDVNMIYVHLAELEVRRQRPQQAIQYVNKAYTISDSCGDMNTKLAAINKSIDIYERFGDYKKMSAMLLLKLKTMDEAQIHEQKTRLQDLETQYKTKLKDEENRSLRTINEGHERQSKFQLTVIMLSVLIGITMSAFAFSYWKQKRRISKEKENVERLNILNQKIFSVISHDFKGPMLGLDVLLGMYDKYGMDQETFSKQTALLRNDLSQANLVMENLLDWSRSELGFTGFEQKKSNPAALFNHVIAQFRLAISQKRLQIENNVSIENEVTIPPDILKIVFRNLLSNAVKYSKEDGKITLGYNSDKQCYILSDQGLGMDEKQVENLFVSRVVYRLGTSQESGYGIGLHLVNELLHKNGGKIWVESELGQGTSFYLILN